MLALNIARSGLTASMMRLNASASNVASSDSVGAIAATSSTASATNTDAKPAAYQPVTVEQHALADGGVATVYARVQPASVPRYDPSSSAADGSGMVAAPNVDLVDESVQQLQARSDFRANVAVIRTADQMQQRLVDLFA